MQALRRPSLPFAPVFLTGAFLYIALLTGALLASAPLPARADMRCAPHLVPLGLTIPEVLERCGRPVFEHHRMETIAPDVWVAVDELIYEQGGNKFRRLLRFENGRLQDIEVLRKPIVPATGDDSF